MKHLNNRMDRILWIGCLGLAWTVKVSGFLPARKVTLFDHELAVLPQRRFYIPHEDEELFQLLQEEEFSQLADAADDDDEQLRLYIPEEDKSVLNGIHPHRQPPNNIPEKVHLYLPEEEEEEEEVEAVSTSAFTRSHRKNKPSRQQAQKEKEIKKPVLYKHLYRYFTDISVDCWLATAESQPFLQSCNYTLADIQDMQTEFPRLLSLNVKAFLAPKVRFIVNTLGGGQGDICDGTELPRDDSEEEFIPHNCQVSQLAKQAVPPIFFGRRLEKTIAPRHGYLVHAGLCHGADLLQQKGRRLKEFLAVCDKPATQFAKLCNQWEVSQHGTFAHRVLHTAELVEAFETVSHRGLLVAAKNIKSPELQLLDCSPGKMVQLLLQHGANAIEHDANGYAMLHWAAGTGNLVGFEALLDHLVQAGQGDNAAEVLQYAAAGDDGATPLHWASCGVTPKGIFGTTGGHAKVCRRLLEKAGKDDPVAAKSLVNTACWDEGGGTPLLWAAWAGSLDVVQLLVSHGADLEFSTSPNQCTVAHFAAAGGNLELCQYLHDELGVSFQEPSKEGHLPLYHALLYGHREVAQWLVALAGEEWRESLWKTVPEQMAGGTVPNLD